MMRTAPLDYMGRPMVLVTTHTQWVGTKTSGHCVTCHSEQFPSLCIPHWESPMTGQASELHTAPVGVYRRAKSLAG